MSTENWHGIFETPQIERPSMNAYALCILYPALFGDKKAADFGLCLTNNTLLSGLKNNYKTKSKFQKLIEREFDFLRIPKSSFI